MNWYMKSVSGDFESSWVPSSFEDATLATVRETFDDLKVWYTCVGTEMVITHGVPLPGGDSHAVIYRVSRA